MNVITKTITLPDGREITIETGKLAKQADGAVVVRMGKTVLLATVTAAKEARPGVDFMPLQVEYKEKFSADGRFPGGFTRREGRMSDHEILIARLVDRALRPLFPEDYHCEVYVQLILFSGDPNEMPDQLAGLAASAAMAVSTVPFDEVLSEVRVIRLDGEWVINPTLDQLSRADIDLMVGATEKNIMMVEGEMREVQESDMIEAIKQAHEAIKVQCRVQNEMARELGTDQKRSYEPDVQDPELEKKIYDSCYDKLFEIAMSADNDKHSRSDRFSQVIADFKEQYSEEELEELEPMINRYYDKYVKLAVRTAVLDHHQRLDGRGLEEVRPIWTEVDCLPAPHGSAIFTRGETQALATVTLGTKDDEKLVDDALFKGKEKFLLHYNFPPFSTGEASRPKGVSRREIGHGNLAMRALQHMIPEDFPYTIRVMSDILESNGSSSMATVCAGTLALEDAGVPMIRPVAGVAMGMMSEGDKKAVLTDILGDEDHMGDMDFKVTGTREGITATQMDIKIDGLSYEVLAQALEQARRARFHILDIIERTIAGPRPELKPQTPRLQQMEVPKEFIGPIIGPGGKVIQGMQEESGAQINIEEDPEHGVGIVQISAANKDAIDKALELINRIVVIPEVGETYEGTIKSVMPYGVFVEFMPGVEGLLHISEWDWKYFSTIEETGVEEGQKVQVKLLEVDPKTGKFRLSRRALLEKPEDFEEKERPRSRRRDRDGKEGDDRHSGRRRNPRRHEELSDDERNTDEERSDERQDEESSDEERPRRQERRRPPRRQEREERSDDEHREDEREERREEEKKKSNDSSERKPSSPADFFKQFGQF